MSVDDTEGPQGTGESEHSEPTPAWCIAANVVLEREFGEDKEIRRGTRHFKPGAKVFIVDFYWGMGAEQLVVIGRHRASGRFIELSMASKHLANLRAELVYSPTVIKAVMAHHQFGRFEAGSDEQRELAEFIAARWMESRGSTQPFVTRPPSPTGSG